MNEDPAAIDRLSARIDALRAQGRLERSAGFVACLIGVAILALARNRLGGAPAMLWAGVGVIALGWLLFVVSIARRYLWARAHPIDQDT